MIGNFARFVARRSFFAVLISLEVIAGWALSSTLLQCVLAAEATGETARNGIQYIDLIHFSHTDIGFTDHPAVCRELQKRYLDVAIDAVLATRDKPEFSRFYWTAEATVSVDGLVASGDA